MRKFLLLVFFLPLLMHSQQSNFFSNITLRVDSSIYEYQSHSISYLGEDYFYFKYIEEQPTVEFRFYCPKPVEKIKLIGSADFKIVDSIQYLGGYYRLKAQFSRLSDTRLISMGFSGIVEGKNEYFLLPILPYKLPLVSLKIQSEEVFLGEEKVYELLCSDPDNIYTDNQWHQIDGIEYRVSLSDGKPRLHVFGTKAGFADAHITIKTKFPYVTSNRKIAFEIATINQRFDVKTSRLAFLEINTKNIIHSSQLSLAGVEVQLEDHDQLQLGKTYRIENQFEPGGALVAEVFIKSRLSNNKVLAILRTYNYHVVSKGYLYLKEGDRAVFLTNFNILHDLEIREIQILNHQGRWVSTRNVLPGQTYDVKILGLGLDTSPILFDGGVLIEQDSLIGNDQTAYFRLKVPMDIKKKEVQLITKGKSLNQALVVQEYNRPADLSFVGLNYGVGNQIISNLPRRILYDHVVRDIRVEFDRDKIDRPEIMNGVQYLDITMELRTSKNQLLDMKTVEDIAVCPSAVSPRYEFYAGTKCNNTSININDYLTKKTYDLDDWSKIYLEVRHSNSRYGGNGNRERIEIIYKRNFSFDIDVSFPAGLLIKRADQNRFDNLGGISMAMISQFTFFHPEKIAVERPYKIGAGFIALNAFNFSENNSNRDIGLVALGSIYPRSGARLTFPLYLGGGYLLSDSDWFFMLGPGIRVSL